MDLWPRIAELLITPPGAVVVLLLISFLGYLKSSWLGSALLALSTGALIATSLPSTGQWLLHDLQDFARPPELVPLADSGPQSHVFAPKATLKDPPQAIVVLGARRYPDAPEYDFQDTVGPLGLERVRYAAWLQRKTGVPILVSGGAPGGERSAEADHMKAVLVDEFKANVKWVERESRTTLENAELSQKLLAAAKIKHVYLVTQAWHMRRAARAFESVGIQVTPAPTGFQILTRREREQAAYLPSAWGMQLTSLALRERLAYWWAGLNEPESGAKPASQTPPSDAVPAPKR
jgi:uncharacterized SAM-binding protein YcdF (DUF218 family)